MVHYCVTNMPGAVGRTSTYALCNVTLPYVLQLAKHGWRAVAASDRGVAEGVNIDRGRITNRAVAATFGLPHSPLDQHAAEAVASPEWQTSRPSGSGSGDLVRPTLYLFSRTASHGESHDEP